MNTFMEGLKTANNYTFTENGALTHKTTKSDLLDMFALGGAYRNRSENDCILLFKNAFEENPLYAMRCLFYLRDVRGGQGERRFFRICYRWLANNHPETALKNMKFIPEYGRFDDLYYLVDTPLEREAMNLMKEQFELDMKCETPSLLAKWLKSINTSSKESRRLGELTCKYFGLTQKEYRKSLSTLRARINVLERLMSAGRWDEIEFDKIPSKAGLKYKNAFARHDLERERNGVQTYEDFARDENTKVNADVLNPVDIAEKIMGNYSYYSPNISQTDRLMLQKYWDNLKDYYNGREERGIAIVDVSGSMTGTPMQAAVSMGAYIAERGKGPFKDHFITFSDRPSLVRFEGVDIVDKFQRAKQADWDGSTNIEAVFKMMLNVALKNHVKSYEMPQTLYIFSDMEFNEGLRFARSAGAEADVNTLLEQIAHEWELYGYELPRVIFWNLDARQNNIPALGGRFSYISGFSMNMIEEVLSGKDGYDLMKAKLDSPRYSVIH